jgi:hypothetical protein
MKYVLFFESVHGVLKAEKILKDKGIVADLIPIPRQLQSDCGVAIELEEDSAEEAVHLLATAHLAPRCFSKDRTGKFERFELSCRN